MILLKNLHELLTLRAPTREAAGRPRLGAEMRQLSIRHRAAVVIEEGLIVQVCDSANIPPALEARCDQVFDGADVRAVFMPGFVDSHTHPIFAATREEEYEMRCEGRTYQQIASAGGGIRSSMGRVREASGDTLYTRARRLERLFLDHGTTCVEAKSGYGLTTGDEVKMLRVIRRLQQDGLLEWVPTFLGAHAIPPEFDEHPDLYVDVIINEMLPTIVNEGLAEFCDVFCEDKYFTVEQSRSILQEARRRGLKLKIHTEEFTHQGGARMAAELGALSADHLEQIRHEDMGFLSRSGTIATLLPGVPFNLGLSHYPPARQLIAAGVPVCLASDFNPGSTYSPNMQLMLTIACSQMKMTPAEAITASTINGAWALDRGHRLGSIEEGKEADIIGLDVDNYRMIPYLYGINHCRLTIKKGQIWQNELLTRVG